MSHSLFVQKTTLYRSRIFNFLSLAKTWLKAFWNKQDSESTEVSPNVSCKAQMLLAELKKKPTASQKELSEVLQCSERAVRIYLSELKQQGYIKIQKRKQKSNLYLIQGWQANACQETAGLVGRADTIKKIEKLNSQGRHILITGQDGMGKSSLLQALSKTLPAKNTILIELSSPQSKLILTIAKHLHAAGYLEDLTSLNRIQNGERENIILQALTKSGLKWIILLDNLKATSVQIPFLEVLTKQFQIVAALSSEKNADNYLFDAFAKVALQPLSEEACDQITERWVSEKTIPVQDLVLLKKELFRRSAGIPKRLMNLLGGLPKNQLISNQIIQEEISEPEEKKYFDLLSLVVIGTGLTVGLRYASLGIENEEGYVSTGFGIAIFLILRFYGSSLRKKK